MNKLRVEEEDDEFEKAFKSLMFESVTKAAGSKISGGSGLSMSSGNVKLTGAFNVDRMGKFII
jgi:hypothetical protein